MRDFAAEGLHHELEAVADAQHRDAELEDFRVAFRGVGLIDAGGAAAQDDPGGVRRADFLRRSLPGDDAAVDVEFADSAGDELTVLGAEIQHEDGFSMVHGSGFHVMAGTSDRTLGDTLKRKKQDLIICHRNVKNPVENLFLY